MPNVAKAKKPKVAKKEKVVKIKKEKKARVPKEPKVKVLKIKKVESVAEPSHPRREVRTPYISNKEFTAEIIACKKRGELSKKAVDFFILLANRTINRLTYENPLDKEDCVQAALLDLCKYWKNFDETKSNNAFAYYTQFVKNGYAKQFKDIHPSFPKDKDGVRHKVKFVSLSQQGDNDVYSI